MKRLSALASITLMLAAIFGCDCYQTVSGGDPGRTYFYTLPDGTTAQATADSQGNVQVPCNVNKDNVVPVPEEEV